MSSRDWDKELAMIDRQLASLSDDKLTGPAEAPRAAPDRAPAAPARPGPAPAAAPAGGVPATVVPRPTWRSRLALAGQLVVTGALAAVATPGVWPWGWRCGSELVIYLVVAGAALLAALLTARASWRQRAGFAHVLALALGLWALTLVTWQVLPRTGVVVPTERIAVPAVWACQ
jgi:hypothetical protein